jgi:uncharacterized membrane protein YkgB
LFFDERGTDFEEMVIHHVATNSLYFCYIYSNIVPYGSMVAYLHDIADIPANFGKVFSSTIYDKVSAAIGVFLLVAWFHTRIFMLP